MPFCLEPGEKTEPGATYVRRSEVSTGKNIEGGELALRTEAVGVALPELGRDVDIEAVDSNSLCSDGFERR